MMHVVCFVALGSWGDVQPMLVLAAAFHSACPAFRVCLVTHACMRDRVNLNADFPRAEVRYVDMPILRVESNESVGTAEDELLMLKDAVGEPDAIIFNLFGIAAYNIAEALSIPCMALHSGAPPPIAAAQRILRQLRQTCPSLARVLRNAEPPCITWNEIEHWMCPLWNKLYSAFRVKHLGLSASPLSRVTDVASLPPPVPLIYSTSPLLLQPPAYWPDSIYVFGGFPSTSKGSLPPEVTLLLPHPPEVPYTRAK
jgi:hypothetical protein